MKTILRVQHWRAKAYYLIGDYKKSLELADEWVKQTEAKYESLNLSTTKPDNFSSLEKAINNQVDGSDDDEEGAIVTEIKDEDAI
jgi:hypothetical protein